MPSIVDSPDLIGFFSYSREDDQDSGGELSRLREKIQRELRALLGRTVKDFRLWQDKTAIAAGSRWAEEINKAISQSMFFIPIVTPTTLRSQYCRFEFDAFIQREKEIGRTDLIFPILYVNIPSLVGTGKQSAGSLPSIIAQRQYVDWTRFRHKEVEWEEVERFCQDVVTALSLEFEAVVRPPPVTRKATLNHTPPQPPYGEEIHDPEPPFVRDDAPRPNGQQGYPLRVSKEGKDRRQFFAMCGLVGGLVLAVSFGLYFTTSSERFAASAMSPASAIGGSTAPSSVPSPSAISTGALSTISSTPLPAPQIPIVPLPDPEPPPAIETVLTKVSQGMWAFGGRQNCGNALKKYGLSMGSGRIRWTLGPSDFDVEAIKQDTALEAQTVTIESHHEKPGKPEAVGTSWSYAMDDEGHLIVRRQSVLLGTLIKCP